LQSVAQVPNKLKCRNKSSADATSAYIGTTKAPTSNANAASRRMTTPLYPSLQ
jgi:hypothetical protein